MKRVLGLVVALGFSASAVGCASHQVVPAIAGAVVGATLADAAYRRPVAVHPPVVAQPYGVTPQYGYPTTYARRPVYVCDYYSIPNRCSWQ
jgi:hypothetical protein